MNLLRPPGGLPRRPPPPFVASGIAARGSGASSAIRRRRPAPVAASPQPPIAPPLRDWPAELTRAVSLESDTPVARGSFGEVFKGVDAATGAPVAVKVMAKARPSLHASAAVDTAVVLQRLHREVDLMGAVKECGNVVQLRGVFEDDRCAYVVLDFVDGGDLEGWLVARDDAAHKGGGNKMKAWPPALATATEAEAAALVFELLKVLTAVAAAGVVHGDVKPANIMLRGAAAEAALAAARGEEPAAGDNAAAAAAAAADDGRPFLALSDFGLARAATPGTTGTRGTPVFMAPEVFRGAYGPPADVWAVGVTAFYLLTRRYPWWPTLAEVLQATPREVRAAVLSPDTVFNPADPALAGLSGECISFLAACLARDPAARPTALAALAHPWFEAALPAGRRREVGAAGRAIAAAAAAAAAKSLPAPPVDGEDEDDDGGDGHPHPHHPDSAALAAFVGVLAHKSMATCEACSFEACPLSGARRALDRVEL